MPSRWQRRDDDDDDDNDDDNRQYRSGGEDQEQQQPDDDDDQDDGQQNDEDGDDNDNDDDDDRNNNSRARAARPRVTRQQEEEEEEEEEDDDDDDDREDDQGGQARRTMARGAGGYEDDGDDEQERTTYQRTNKPMSDPNEVDSDELYQAAVTVMKHLLVQTHNAQGVASGTASHQDASDQLIDQHPNDDWRIQYLQTSDADGNPVKLEAKMDTGADANLISFDAAQEHGLEIEDITGQAPQFTVGSGAETGVDGTVSMRYRVGSPPKPYEEQFYAKDGLPHDIILGMPFLLHSHAITVNPSFAKTQSSGDFLLFETTAASSKTQDDRKNFAAQQAERKQANLAAKKAAVKR